MCVTCRCAYVVSEKAMDPIILVTLIHITLHTWILTSWEGTLWIDVKYLLLTFSFFCSSSYFYGASGCSQTMNSQMWQTTACYSESLCIHWEEHKFYPSIEWMHGQFLHCMLPEGTSSQNSVLLYSMWGRGGVVVKALRYKPAGRGFDSQWCHWNFSVT